MIADQLVEDFRSGTWSVEGVRPWVVHQGDDGAVGRLGSWFDMARFHGEEFQEDPPIPRWSGNCPAGKTYR